MFRNSECYDAMASLDDVLALHILDCIYRKDFEKVVEAILNGVAMLQSASESDSTCKNNGKVVTM